MEEAREMPEVPRSTTFYLSNDNFKDTKSFKLGALISFNFSGIIKSERIDNDKKIEKSISLTSLKTQSRRIE